MTVKEGGPLSVSQKAHNATHPLIQTLMKRLHPLVSSPFQWLQLHPKTTSPARLNPSMLCSTDLATAHPCRVPSLVSLMSKQLPSKQWTSILNFFPCSKVCREKILEELQDGYLHQCVLAHVKPCSSPESLLYRVLRTF